MIPMRFLSKMDTYNITINCVHVKATYLDNNALVDSCISEILRHNLTRDSPVVGIDFKSCTPPRIDLLLIYIENRCLIIHLGRMSSLPSSLSSFLSDNTICFVGPRMSYPFDRILSNFDKKFEDGNSMSALLRSRVEVNYLAARVLKNRALQSCGSLAELANKTGFDFREEKDRIGSFLEWNAGCFSNEEVKHAMREAYLCYNIGKTVLSTLN